MTVYLLDNIPALKAGIGSRRAVGNVRDYDPLHLQPKPKLLTNAAGELVNLNTRHRTMFSATFLGRPILSAGSFAQRELQVPYMATTIHL